MRFLGGLFFTALVLCSCVSADRNVVPDIRLMEAGARENEVCTRMFPREPWQYVHALTFRLANGDRGSAMGVVLLDKKNIRCALMTVEGLTLFEAQIATDGQIEIFRALPPFDGQAFASGLMRDLGVLFRPPPGSLRQGRLKDGRLICRFETPKRITDILPLDEGCWQIRLYTDRVGAVAIDTRACHAVASVFVADTMELTVPGPVGYTINLRLLSAEPLSRER